MKNTECCNQNCNQGSDCPLRTVEDKDARIGDLEALLKFADERINKLVDAQSAPQQKGEWSREVVQGYLVIRHPLGDSYEFPLSMLADHFAQAAPQAVQPAELAPPNSLPTFDECALRVENSNFLEKRAAGGGYGPEHDSKTATQLHRFIYEYDDADPVRSSWFLHRLELLLNEVLSATHPSQPSAHPAEGVPVQAEFPTGAIVNGRTHIERLEAHYQFECDAGSLVMCDDWNELKRYFEHLANWAYAATQQGLDESKVHNKNLNAFIEFANQIDFAKPRTASLKRKFIIDTRDAILGMYRDLNAAQAKQG